MVFRIFSIVFPIIAIVAVGYVYARYRRPDMGVANQVNMDVFLPALIIHVLSQKEFVPYQYGSLAMGGLLVILGSGVLAYPIARRLGMDWRTVVPPMMFSNYGNLGLPLFVFAYGESALSAAVVLFIVGNILHFTLGRFLLDRTIHPLELLRTPILIAAVIGITLSASDSQLPQVLALPIKMMGQVSIPLLLFSLGVRLIEVDWGDWKYGVIGALVCPALGILLALLIVPLLDMSDLQSRQLILFGALPPAVLNYLFAERFAQEPQKVASMVMLGNVASVLIIPVMLVFLLT